MSDPDAIPLVLGVQAPPLAQQTQSQTTLQAFLSEWSRREHKVPTFSINKLGQKDEYDTWRYQLDGVLGRLDVRHLVQQLQQLGDVEHYLPELLKSWMTHHQATALLAVGTEVRSKLAGGALELCAGRQASSIVSILRVLDEAYGQVKQVDQMALLSRFTTERFDSAREELPQWIARKYATAVKLPTMLPPGPAFEASMMNVLLSLLPYHFDAVCNELRANLPASWRQVESRLIDYDRGAQQRTEVQGQVYNVSVKGEESALSRLEQRVEELTALVAKTRQPKSQGARRDACWWCGEPGHKKVDCAKRTKAVKKVGQKTSKTKVQDSRS